MLCFKCQSLVHPGEAVRTGPLNLVQIRAICTDCNLFFSFLFPALSRKCCGSAGARRVNDAGGFPGLFTASAALALKW